MQSFLQYRRFGKKVRAQYERDQEKAAARGQYGASASSSDSPASTTPPSDSTSDGIYDLEKGEGSDDPKQIDVDVGSNVPDPASVLDTPTHESRQHDLNRMRTAATEKSMGTNLGLAMTGIEVRRRTTKEGGDHARVFVVGYEGSDDSMNPHNWSFLTRITAT